MELFEDKNIEKQFEDKETKIGQKLTETTSKKIIMIVLIIMISIPIFTADTYTTSYVIHQGGVDTLHKIVNQPNFSMNDPIFVETWDYIVKEYSKFYAKLIVLQLNLGSDSKVIKEYGDISEFTDHRSYEYEGMSFPSLLILLSHPPIQLSIN